VSGADTAEVVVSKSSDKPKKQQKQKPQKTLKQRRSEKRAAKRTGSGPLLPADR
jgi:hypothetical protein